jgi:hypothetical protein
VRLGQTTYISSFGLPKGWRLHEVIQDIRQVGIDSKLVAEGCEVGQRGQPCQRVEHDIVRDPPIERPANRDI